MKSQMGIKKKNGKIVLLINRSFYEFAKVQVNLCVNFDLFIVSARDDSRLSDLEWNPIDAIDSLLATLSLHIVQLCERIKYTINLMMTNCAVFSMKSASLEDSCVRIHCLQSSCSFCSTCAMHRKVFTEYANCIQSSS